MPLCRVHRLRSAATCVIILFASNTTVGIRAGEALFPWPATPFGDLYCCGDFCFPGELALCASLL
jgi:hypothetical protein